MWIKLTLQLQLLVFKVITPNFGEDSWVLVSQFEDRLVVWLEQLLNVGIGCGPLIIIESMVKHFRAEYWCHQYSLVEQFY